MGENLATLRARCTTHLLNRTDLDTEIDQALNDQVRQLSSGAVIQNRALQLPELEYTVESFVLASGNDKIAVADIESGESPAIEIFAIVTIRDETNLTKLTTLSIRDRDNMTVTSGIAARYVRYGSDILLDAILSANTTYQIRVRRYHPLMTDSVGSLFPNTYNELIAIGASLRIARDILRNFDLADELEKQFTRTGRAMGFTKEEDARDNEFGVVVRMD